MNWPQDCSYSPPSPSFDDELSKAMCHYQQVEVSLPTSIDPDEGEMPAELEKWIAAIEFNGGKVNYEPLKGDSSLAFLMIIGISFKAYEFKSIWYEEYKEQHSQYNVAKNYDARLCYEINTILVTKIVFIKRSDSNERACHDSDSNIIVPFDNTSRMTKRETTTEKTIMVERYPTIECRDKVKTGQEFAVQVSLTEDLFTPQVRTTPNPDIEMNVKVTAAGKLAVPLPNNEGPWKIDVVLSAPGFDFRDSETAQIILPRYGDSSVGLFHLTPKPIQTPKQVQKLRATLWHQGAYLARIVREVTVTNKSRGNLRQAQGFRSPSTGLTSQFDPPSSTPKQEDEKQAFNLGLQSPDMTIYLEHHFLPNRSMIAIHSKILKRFKGSFPRSPKVLSQWLDDYYGYFTRASQNMITLASYGQSTQSEKEQNIALLKGFGRQLYEQFAPQEFKNAFWALKDKLGDEFDTIHIFTDDPLMPWELMIPSRGNEELDFLGIDFQIARWHISENPAQLDRPSQSLNMQKLLAIVPDYPDDPLFAVSNELEVLQNITGFRRVSGRYAALSQLFKNAETDNSLIHFSGHGIVQKTRRGLTRYAIKLEDGKLDLMTWRGLMPRHHQTHPFFFFNACDVGQAHHVANFVDGWAPAVLEAGASGYIGGLWPLVNKGATAFAELFYQQLEAILKTERPANVADLLRKTRKRFYENGDPTFLGYVYYGDPHFQLVRE